ncbi:MAG: cytochrome B [Zetaproteobacteria bacterium CG12_big_fil_rev_8_21_14_0_65_54_13]|nr:MAG: cytochrome B [Zetaproteobacteria bacterium CG12_big_fil_rev_8_21_14_0_65_54_13]PIX53835.1 MAG: cytochrome B [Zetaproteobacteria bacterium CG_4_10_14_3_um_filter_54_28]PJA30823.1 MAG: cytochrome B [Zetaproteobacteria bacterium CG_4_9_14_3_um_filter_54_145]
MKRSWLRRSYDWTLAWSTHAQASWALFIIAMIEASVFPIPPDILLLAMALARPQKALRFAAIATAGSVIGAMIGYGIGMFLFAAIAQPLLEFYHALDRFAEVQQLFAEYGVAIVLIAGFSPIPFKIITIAAGAFGLSFPLFIAAALLSRGARFYLEGALLRWGGESLRQLVERHFEWLTVAVVVAVVGGFALLWL